MYIYIKYTPIYLFHNSTDIIDRDFKSILNCILKPSIGCVLFETIDHLKIPTKQISKKLCGILTYTKYKVLDDATTA